MVKFLPVKDWGVLSMNYWVFDFLEAFMEHQAREVDYSIKLWPLNLKLFPELKLSTKSQKLQAWAKKNTWFGIDFDMTEAALKFSHTLLHKDAVLTGLEDESPEYFEILDAYMKAHFYDFFYKTEHVYFMKHDDPEAPYYEKDSLYFKNVHDHKVVTSEHYQLSKGGTVEALNKWIESKNDELHLIRYRQIYDCTDFPPLKNFIEIPRH